MIITVPGDKSISHRALLLSVLAEGTSELSGLLPGADCRSTASVMRALGASMPDLPPDGSEIRVPGVGPKGLRSPKGELDCGNSGTTARLLLGLLAGLSIEATLTGDASLRSRPMRRVTDPLSRMGARFEEGPKEDRLPLTVRGGGLSPFSYRSPVASAQVKSALLLAGLTGGVAVEVEEPERSRDHTERMLRRIGCRVEEGTGEAGWRVRLAEIPRALRPLDFHVPGDFSSAAFFLALALLGGAGSALRITNVGLNPTRTGLLDVLREMGGRIEVERQRETDDPAGEPAADLIAYPSELRGVTIGGEVIPRLIDEVPILAVVGARARGVTEIRDAEELRVKESDRVRVLVENLGTLGADVEERPDGLRVSGHDRPLQGSIAVHHDHRIAMAFGVLGALPGQNVVVDDPEVADVSFPGFWRLLAECAGAVEGGRAS